MNATKRMLGLIFLTVAVDLVGFGIILPNLPLYAEALGASAAWVGVLFASYSVMQFVFAPIWGRLSDRIGRRPVLLGSIAGNIVALLVFAFAKDFWWLLLSRTMAGLCTANISVANAYVADILPPEKRAKGMGLIGAAFGIGFVVGPFIGGEMSRWGFAAPPLCAVALSVLNGVGAYFWLPETLSADHRASRTERGPHALLQALKLPTAARLIVLGFFQVLAFSMLEMAFVLFAERRLGFAARQSGRVFVYIGLVLVLVQGGLIGPLVRRYGERAVVIAGMFSIALGMLLIPQTPQGAWPIFLGCVTFVSFGHGLAAPSLSGMLSRRAPPHAQGLFLGASQSASALARVAGPTAAGILFAHISENAPFLAGGVLMTVSAAWALFSLRE